MTGLAGRLRERTRALHVEAERSGFVRDILRGQANRAGYALFVRNLLPAYQELERGLERHAGISAVGAVAHPALSRSAALAADLDRLCGPNWARSVPQLPAGARYARRVAEAAGDGGARLIAHAYVRYLGDLNGGQILKQLLARRMGLDADSLNFYDFAEIDDLGRFTAAYLAALDRAGSEIGDVDHVVEEAALAFRLNIDLSCAVQDAMAEANQAALV